MLPDVTSGPMLVTLALIERQERAELLALLFVVGFAVCFVIGCLRLVRRYERSRLAARSNRSASRSRYHRAFSRDLSS